MSFVLLGILLGLGWIAAPFVLAALLGVMRGILMIPTMIAVAIGLTVRVLVGLVGYALPVVGLVLLILINRRYPGVLLAVLLCAALGSAFEPEIRKVIHYIRTKVRQMQASGSPSI